MAKAVPQTAATMGMDRAVNPDSINLFLAVRKIGRTLPIFWLIRCLIVSIFKILIQIV